MNVITKLFSIAFIIFFSACDQSPLGASCKRRDDEYLVNIVTRKAALQLQEELGLQLVGTGAGMMDEIRMLALSFEYDHLINACQGRKLLVRAVDVFMATVNENIEIRAYLTRYPFTPENIEIRIFLRNTNRSSPPPGELYCISAIDGLLEYNVEHPATTRLVTAYQETYQEAVSKVATNSTEPQQLIVPSPENFLDRPGASRTVSKNLF